MTATTKKKRVKTLSSLKKECDTWHSRYILTKYPKVCYTCGGRGKLQCGHFISRSYLATRYLENNTRPQCIGCNIFGGGKPLDFEENLKSELGDKYVEDMKASRHIITRLSPAWYEERIAFYKNELKYME